MQRADRQAQLAELTGYTGGKQERDQKGLIRKWSGCCPRRRSTCRLLPWSMPPGGRITMPKQPRGGMPGWHNAEHHDFDILSARTRPPLRLGAAARRRNVTRLLLLAPAVLLVTSFVLILRVMALIDSFHNDGSWTIENFVTIVTVVPYPRIQWNQSLLRRQPPC